MGTSKTVSFKVEVPYPTMVVLAFIAVVASTDISLASYLIKTRR
jgi:hypothetical protein